MMSLSDESVWALGAWLKTTVFNRPVDRSDTHFSLRPQKFSYQPRMETSFLFE